MRVYIGKYPNYNKKTKKTPERKIRVEIHKYDAWSADHTLALIILPVLKVLQKNKHGAPHTDDADVPVKLRSTSAPKKKNEWDTDSLFFKRWDWILGEMIWAFEQIIDEDSEDKFRTGKADIWWQALDKDYKKIGKPVPWKGKKNPILSDAVYWQIVKGPKDTYKVDQKGLDAHWARQKVGLTLFGKYYRTLWD